jgi:hypothetical protein
VKCSEIKKVSRTIWILLSIEIQVDTIESIFALAQISITLAITFILGFRIKIYGIAGLALKRIKLSLKSDGNPFRFLKKPTERLDVFVAYFVSDFFDALVRIA